MAFASHHVFSEGGLLRVHRSSVDRYARARRLLLKLR
jgi:hypothetical protein